jgi:predicted nucleic acid-binding protein
MWRTHAADLWRAANLMANPMGAHDAFIVASAEVHGLILLTRNASDFAAIVNDILTPWNEVRHRSPL